jgi:hypothetical protein
MAARLKAHYQKAVIPALVKEFGYENVMAVPKLEKISINMGVGEATQTPKMMDGVANELSQIAGQRAVVTKAKKSVAAFKVREGMPIGCMVTLRGDRMYEFLDRLISISLTRQLHPWSEGPVDLPGDRLQQGGKDQGHEHQLHDDGRNRRRSAVAAETSGNAVPRLRRSEG